MISSAAQTFDPSEPQLRRIKPLPKRRRTASFIPDGYQDLLQSALSLTGSIADELAATFASPLAFDPYFASAAAFSANHPSFHQFATETQAQGLKRSDAFLPFIQDNVHGDGDDDADTNGYVGHLQEPGNTKKRKVPLTSASGNFGDGSSAWGDEDQLDRNVSPRFDIVNPLENDTTSHSTSLLSHRKGKLSRASLALIQHKELVDTRKRQLTAVIDALSEGDPLALEQALSSNTLWYKRSGDGNDKDGASHTLRRRSTKPVERITWHPETHANDENEFPSADFTFKKDCATSDHVRKTKEEVAALQSRFEIELSRQTAKAARKAAQHLQKAKRGEIERATRAASTPTHGRGNDLSSGIMDLTLNTKTKTKKKKRSAMANASNPHHLRNYVPSRLPHTAPVHTAAQNPLFPIPLRFLSANLRPKKKKTEDYGNLPTSQLINPEDEWICPFCEYKLFYGDDQARRLAVKNRKKILARRRQARERAAAAANGRKSIAPLDKQDAVHDDDDSFIGGDQMAMPAATVVSKHAQFEKDRSEDGDRSKDRDRPTRKESTQLG